MPYIANWNLERNKQKLTAYRVGDAIDWSRKGKVKLSDFVYVAQTGGAVSETGFYCQGVLETQNINGVVIRVTQMLDTPIPPKRVGLPEIRLRIGPPAEIREKPIIAALARGFDEAAKRSGSFIVDENTIIEDNDSQNAEEGQPEGGPKKGTSTYYERNQANRVAAIRIHKTTCMVCDFDFGNKYGDRGDGYIEVHHIRPLSQQGQKYTPNLKDDFAVVCANCHRMIHRRKKDILSIAQLKKLLR